MERAVYYQMLVLTRQTTLRHNLVQKHVVQAVRSGDRIRVEGENFRTRPDRPSGPSSLLNNGYRVFLGGKAAGAWVLPPNHTWRQG